MEFEGFFKWVVNGRICDYVEVYIFGLILSSLDSESILEVFVFFVWYLFKFYEIVVMENEI